MSLLKLLPLELEELILDYKYQLEISKKYKFCIDNIKCIDYQIIGNHSIRERYNQVHKQIVITDSYYHPYGDQATEIETSKKGSQRIMCYWLFENNHISLYTIV